MDRRWALLTLLLACTSATAAASAQAPTELRGEAILSHPAGRLAIRAAELLVAGKTDEVIRLRTAEDQAEWRKEPAAERKAMGERMQERAPDPAAMTEGIRTGGVLTVYPQRATLYAGALHSGPGDGFMSLASSKAQAEWRAHPASERAESTAYRKKKVPARSALAGAIRTGGLLILQGDGSASLNVTTVAQESTAPGTVSASSTTFSIPFVLENGAWRLAR